VEIFENEHILIMSSHDDKGEPVARVTLSEDEATLTLAEASNLVFGLNTWMKVEYTKKMVKGEGSYNTAFKVR